MRKLKNCSITTRVVNVSFFFTLKDNVLSKNFLINCFKHTEVVVYSSSKL